MAEARPLDVHVFQHVPFEGLGSMEGWVGDRGHAVSRTRFWLGEHPPAPSAYDLLIVMGGPMGVHDDQTLPWMMAEKRALVSALRADKAVLGVCLGAQLMADVLGAPVTRNRHKEIGWFPVELGEEARQTWMAEAFPRKFTAFHWHGDTFDIPAGAVPLGGSEACAHQGFLYGGKALALQFHPEVTPDAVDALIRACGPELKEAPYIQGADALRAGLGHAPALNAMMAKACGFLEAACRAA